MPKDGPGTRAHSAGSVEDSKAQIQIVGYPKVRPSFCIFKYDDVTSCKRIVLRVVETKNWGSS